MNVLFLGGPWHNERHEVTPARLASAARSLPTHFTVPVAIAHPRTADPAAPAHSHVTYTRRYARSNGERLPVYVAPGYQGPPRA
ncbi:hypothetical protein V6U90_16585 [Micromonospora sp. CPCC 206060]|uniref:hypothetical protein n=1 Tax=Micromonospora sp. CPCC 206060 TaxID=3122406 RepID=UPI002FEEFDA2